MASRSDMRNEQYEAQFFEFSPSSFLEGVKGIILDRLCEAVDHLESHLSKVQGEGLPHEEVQQGINLLRQQTDTNFTKTFQKFESHILESIMNVPPHILLPTDMEQATQPSTSEIIKVNTEIEKLHMELKNEKYLHAKLEEELQDIDLVLGEQQKVLNDTLSESRMANFEEAKEKLVLIQGIESETHSAGARVQEVTKLLKMEGANSPLQILETDVFK
ncbi:protein MIS12 homolog [Homarus americanus]|uniref:Protein MIS12 homolog n=1 Tax=Homarus americanus TaxID=6706 RepID=A0A8J5MYC5_HOMAM|nr:protein MIS12 homolog [Homarus americanus]KAG7169025.1 MIS12-like [Homarus americanus]